MFKFFSNLLNIPIKYQLYYFINPYLIKIEWELKSFIFPSYILNFKNM